MCLCIPLLCPCWLLCGGPIEVPVGQWLSWQAPHPGESEETALSASSCNYIQMQIPVRCTESSTNAWKTFFFFVLKNKETKSQLHNALLHHQPFQFLLLDSEVSCNTHVYALKVPHLWSLKMSWRKCLSILGKREYSCFSFRRLAPSRRSRSARLCLDWKKCKDRVSTRRVYY